MNKFPLVSIIIVNWNGGLVFKDCLNSLKKITYPNWELIVVDNGSSDDSLTALELVKIPARQIKVIKNRINLGFAPANNQALKKAKGEYLLLLNNDTKVTPNLLDLLVKKMESNPELGVIQPKIHIMDYPGLIDNCGSFFTKTGFLEHWGYFAKDSKKFNQETKVFSVKGACMLTRKEVVKRVGLFDDDFMSYFEETDFCWRVWLAGWQVLFYPSAHIFHKVGYSSKRQSQLVVNYHSLKNRIMSLIKNLNLFNLFTVGLLHILLIIGLGLYYLIKLQFPKFIMIWQAIIWNIVNLPGTISKRSYIQKIRVKKDDEIFKYTLKPVNLWEMFNHFLKVEANFK